MKEEVFDAQFDPKKIKSESGFTIIRVTVFPPLFGEPTIEFWLYSPDSKKIAVFEGQENEVIALAALAGIENHVKETEQ